MKIVPVLDAHEHIQSLEEVRAGSGRIMVEGLRNYSRKEV
jgi:hypothetical protein